MRAKTALTAAFIAALLCMSAAANAGEKGKQPGKVIAGWVEKITLLDYGDKPIKAKLDSGAKTSSLHASKIEAFERDGEDWVRFTFEDKDGEKAVFERPEVRGVKIKDLGGGFDRRHVVELDLCFDGRIHTTQFTLTDRSGFIYRVLLGRRFLAGVAVIDPESIYLTKDHCIDMPDKADSSEDDDD